MMRMTRCHTVREFGATVFHHPRKDAAEGKEGKGSKDGDLVRKDEEPSSGETQEEPGLTTGPAVPIAKAPNGPGWAWWGALGADHHHDGTSQAKASETSVATLARASKASKATLAEAEMVEATLAEATEASEATKVTLPEVTEASGADHPDQTTAPAAVVVGESRGIRDRTQTHIEELMGGRCAPQGNKTAEHGVKP